MTYPVYPTIPTAFLFQKFANINWQMYGRTEGKHMGVDIGVAGNQPGAAIYAVHHGTVADAGYYEQGGYGRRVVIEHENRTYSSLYAHLKDVIVKEGDVVVGGVKIGTMGGNVEDKFRGASLGTHLHFGVILPQQVKNSIKTSKGWCVDPIPYLMQRYFPAPVNAIRVTTVKGLRVRVQPNVKSQSNTALIYGEVANVMEVLPEEGGAQWVKLWTLRDEYCGMKYGNQVNAEFTKPIDVTPLPDSIVDPGSTASAEQGYGRAVVEMKNFIEGMKYAS